MTSIPTPDTTGTPEVTQLIRGADTILPRTADDNSALINAIAAHSATSGFVQKARASESTGILGLYMEAVVFASTGKPFAHLRFFVIDRHIYVYNRSAGETRANWRIRTEESLLAALMVVEEAMSRPTVQLFGHPVLVELTADDVSAVESGAMPPARFRGAYRIERDFGRFDFEMPVTSKEMPARLVKLLRDKRWVAETAVAS